MLMTKRKKLPGLGRANGASALSLAFFLSACAYNGNGNQARLSSASNKTSTTVTVTNTTYKITNVTVQASSTSGTGTSTTTTTTTTTGTSTSSTAPIATLFFDPSQIPTPIAQNCSGSQSGQTGTKPCLCSFTWQEVNKSTGINVSVPRSVLTPVLKVQTSIITCNVPATYLTEILDGTTLHISVIPGGGSGSSFTTNVFNYVKSSQVAAGSFQDAQGATFDNILHYACYNQFQRGMDIKNKLVTTAPDQNGNTVTYPVGSQFCIQTINGGAQAQPGCQTLAPPDNSAQANYFNFYIRDSERGDINLGNDSFVCPQVLEPIRGNSNVGTQGLPYPLDTNFALSLGKTVNFQVGVDAFTKLSNGGDPTAQNSSCTGTPPTGTTNVVSCLGFAAQPNSDGTCPSFKDSNGLIRSTFRLRRYVAIYPPIFDSNGNFLKKPQATDTVFVLDRPVNAPNSDPLKPFTMKGPKPCPHAYFDKKGVTGLIDAAYNTSTTGGLRPQYAATISAAWNNTNVDGIQFPNFDDGPKSCAAVLPIMDKNDTFFTFATVYSQSLASVERNPHFPRQYIRPIQSWAPHFEEDTSFQACAPQASPAKDPPLHFAKDPATGNIAWCTESYPTQNNNVGQLDLAASATTPPSTTNNFVGKVQNYTSHIAKNSASAACGFTSPTIPNFYPAAGVAFHPNTLFIDNNGPPGALVPVDANQTCDRTVITPNLAWPRYPLLAPPADVEKAISADSSYFCTVTYDNSGPKTGVRTPTQGCCGPNVSLYTGTGNSTLQLRNVSAHLEPDVPCLIPQY